MSDVHCPARIIVARHGQAEYESPEMNESGGSLTTLGREQARELGERLRTEKIAAVMCSELSRAVQTAEIAAAVLDGIADEFRGETVLVVSHGGVILALWGAIDPRSARSPRPGEVFNGSSYVFERDADGWRSTG